jgi:rhamnulokinase
VARRVFAAVDLGASGGRVMSGVVESGTVSLHPVHRFRNGARERDGHLRWPISELFEEVLVGLGHLTRNYPDVESIGVDTWGVDYALLDADGRLLAEPVSYRDGRTAQSVGRVHERVTPDELFAVNGLQFLPFSTLYQLEEERHEQIWSHTASVVLLPDLLAYWLTGVLVAERTNASTTGLLDVHSHEWSTDLLTRLEIPADRLSRLASPGQVLGPLRADVALRLGAGPRVVVTTVGSHDTASAVAAVPATDDRFAYASSGTWSLVGVELDAPILSPAAQEANFTNELGVGNRTRFLRNTGGLWLLSESLRTWAAHGLPANLDTLLQQAAALPAGRWIIDVNDPTLLAPDEMPARIAALLEGAISPDCPPEMVRCIVDSLAQAYADAARQAADLTARHIDVLHLVGGGSQNPLLCQATADAAALPVVTGPVEATALGNVLVQAQAHGAVGDSLEEARSVIATSIELGRYRPR